MHLSYDLIFFVSAANELKQRQILEAKLQLDSNISTQKPEVEKCPPDLPFFINHETDAENQNEKSWKIKGTKCRTQRIMEKAQAEGQ